MEEQKQEKTFTEKEVMEIVSKMQNDFNIKMQEYNNALNEINSTLNRLNFLLKIVSIKDVFSKEFINNCASEIETIMTIPNEEDEPKTEE